MVDRRGAIWCAALLVSAWGSAGVERAQAGECAVLLNGDTNGDGERGISDASYLLNWLFLGGPEPVEICTSEALASRVAELEGEVEGLEAENERLRAALLACAPALPATGQTVCSDMNGAIVPCEDARFPGQDGSVRAGCAMDGRFVDNGDGTVTDHCTGLMWLRDTADVDGDGMVTEGNDAVMWDDALDYCDDLAFPPGPGAAYTDWRLPNIVELHSLVDYGRFMPAIDPAFGVLFENADYWSSTPGAGAPDLVWTFNYRYGQQTVWRKTVGLYLRAVRTVTEACGIPATGQTACFDNNVKLGECPDDEAALFPGQDGFYENGCSLDGRFLENGDGTVTDLCTGLMWQRRTARPAGVYDSGNDFMSWEKALAYCADLGDRGPGRFDVDEEFDGAGYGDWRLPNVKELESIIQYGPGYPAVDGSFTVTSDDPAVFHIRPSGAVYEEEYWTSTTLEEPKVDLGETSHYVEYSWTVNLRWGYRDTFHKTNHWYVIAVRGP